MWEPQLGTFAQSLRLIAPDFRGCGESDAGDGQYTMESLVDDALGVLDALGIEHCIGCGLSMGGYVLLRAVEREPARFAGAVFCDTKSEADSDEGRLARARAVSMVRDHGVERFAEELLPRVLGRTTLARRPELVAAVRSMMLAAAPAGLIGLQLAMAGRTDTTAGLGRIAVPCLIVVGEEDELTPPATAREMAERIPGASLEVIPEAGHLCNLENASAFDAVVRPFLESVSVAASSSVEGNHGR